MSSVAAAIRNMKAGLAHLASPEFPHDFVQATPAAREAIKESLLGCAAVLDISVSQYNGSPFNSIEASAWNQNLNNIRDAYDVPAVRLGTNGSSNLNVSMVKSLAWEDEGLLVVRDAHISTYWGLNDSGAVPHIVSVPFDPVFGVSLPLTARELRSAIVAANEKGPKVKAVVTTTPTYFGLQGNIAGYKSVCDEFQIPLMCDAAWAPHYKLLHGCGFPPAAEDWADLTTQSTHKMLPALSQGSICLWRNSSLLERFDRLWKNGGLSTSFSHLLAISVWHGIQQTKNDNGRAAWLQTAEIVAEFRDEIATIDGLRVMQEADIVDGDRVVALDPARLLVNVRGLGLSGYSAAKILKEQFGIAVELATTDAVFFLFSPAHGRGFGQHLVHSLRQLPKGTAAISATLIPPPPSAFAMTPRATLHPSVRKETVPAHATIGRVSADLCCVFPPGQGILVPGQIVTGEVVDYMARVVQAGGHMHRTQTPDADDAFETLQVVKE